MKKHWESRQCAWCQRPFTSTMHRRVFVNSKTQRVGKLCITCAGKYDRIMIGCCSREASPARRSEERTMSDEPRLRLPPTPAEVDEMRNTILDLRADLAQTRAVAAAIMEMIALHEWEERFDAIGSEVVEACLVCGAMREQGHGTDCWLGQLLSQHKEPTNGEEESETQARPAQAEDGVGGGA